jgi:two-component system, LytTR family, response regulator
MRALIVDDEPLARRGVAHRLRKFRNIEIVGECGDGASALKNILELSPDVVFLDVQMPEMDGFDVLRALPQDNIPAIIFLTAYEKHALQAFEYHALDYLLKPIDDTRLAASVSRAFKQIDSNLRATQADRILAMLSQRSTKYVARFAVQIGSHIQIVLADDVEWIGAAGDYVELHVGGRSHLIRETMASLERKLDPAKFLRIQRSRIVQTSSILELRLVENREFVIKLSDGSDHRSGRTYADRLEHWLSSGTS